MAAGLDRAQIGEEIGGAAQSLERIAAPILGRSVNAGLDVTPVPLDEPPQIGDQPLAVGHRPAARRCGAGAGFVRRATSALWPKYHPIRAACVASNASFSKVLAMTALRYGQTRRLQYGETQR